MFDYDTFLAKYKHYLNLKKNVKILQYFDDAMIYEF